MNLSLITEKSLLGKIILFYIWIQTSITWGKINTGLREEFMSLTEYSLKRQNIELKINLFTYNKFRTEVPLPSPKKIIFRNFSET